MKPKWKTNPSPGLAERLRQFEIICILKYSFSKQIGYAVAGGGNLNQIGRDKFGLRTTHVTYCMGRARNFIDQMSELARARAKRGLPADSDAMIAQFAMAREKKAA